MLEQEQSLAIMMARKNIKLEKEIEDILDKIDE